MNRLWCHEAFSLIELLMASVVVAAGGAMLIGGLVAANRSRELRIEQLLATQLLAGRLAELDDEIGAETPMSGTFAEPLDEFAWSLEHNDPSPDGLAQATLTVSHDDHHTHAVTLRRLQQ